MHILKEFFRHYKIVLIPSHFDKVWQKKPLSKVLFTQFHTFFALICFRNIWTKISLLWAEPLSCFIAEAPSSKLTCVTNWKCLHIALFSTHQNPLFSIKFRCQMSKAYMSLHKNVNGKLVSICFIFKYWKQPNTKKVTLFLLYHKLAFCSCFFPPEIKPPS